MVFYKVSYTLCQMSDEEKQNNLKLKKKTSHLEEAVTDGFFIGCGPVISARLGILNLVASDWSRTSINRFLPLNHHRVVSHLTEGQVVSRP